MDTQIERFQTPLFPLKSLCKERKLKVVWMHWNEHDMLTRLKRITWTVSSIPPPSKLPREKTSTLIACIMVYCDICTVGKRERGKKKKSTSNL